MSIRRALSAILIAAGLMTLGGAACARDYPTRPITLIIPWPPGGSTDVAMRAIAEAASRHLGQPFKKWEDVVEYGRKFPEKITYGMPNYKSTVDYSTAVATQIKLEEALLRRLDLLRKP